MKKLTKGFSLIELLVVIAIIGILATVVILNITGAQKKARRNGAIANMNEVLKVASGCIINDGLLTLPTPALGPHPEANLAGLAVCTGTSDETILNTTWPDLAGDWSYAITFSGFDASSTKGTGIGTVTVTPRAGDLTVTESVVCTSVQCVIE